MGKYNLIVVWGLIVAAMFFLPATPVLIMACMAGIMIYSFGYADEVLSFFPLIIWEADQARKTADQPVFRRKLLGRIESALKKTDLESERPVAAYSSGSLRNCKLAISLSLYAGALSFLLLIVLVSDNDSWLRYFPIIVFFVAVLLVSILVIGVIYWANREKFIALKIIRCLEAKVELLQQNGPDYPELDKTLNTLSTISPADFWYDKFLYDLERSYCLDATGRVEEALALVRKAETDFERGRSGKPSPYLRDDYQPSLLPDLGYDFGLMDVKRREVSLCLSAGRVKEARSILGQIRSRPAHYNSEDQRLGLYEAAIALGEGKPDLARLCLESALECGAGSYWREEMLGIMDSEPGLRALAAWLRKRLSCDAAAEASR